MTAAAGSLSWKQRALQHAQPICAMLELTYRCNWRCGFCYNPRHRDLRGLKGAEWVEVIVELRELGTLTVTLTGGEPLLHPDFFRIARAVREQGFALRVFTNGSLIDAETAQRLAELHPMGVELSLHGATAATHDGTTGTPGSWSSLVQALDRLEASGVRVLLKTPLTRLNEGELDAMIAFAAERRVPYLVDPTLSPRDDGSMKPLEYSASDDVIASLLRNPTVRTSLGEQVREKGGVNCGLGRITLAVDPEGNVYPCPQWRHSSLGNVRDTRLTTLWRESEARRQAAEVARLANDRLLEAGGPVARFAFCPALAFRTTGDPTRPDARTSGRAALVAKLRAAEP